MKLALVTIVTATLEPMRTFYQEVDQRAHVHAGPRCCRSSPRSTVATMSNSLNLSHFVAY